MECVWRRGRRGTVAREVFYPLRAGGEVERPSELRLHRQGAGTKSTLTLSLWCPLYPPQPNNASLVRPSSERFQVVAPNTFRALRGNLSTNLFFGLPSGGITELATSVG